MSSATGHASPSSPLLDVRDLHVGFRQAGRVVDAVKKVSFQLAPSETLALVGESGSGKSLTALSLLQLLPYPQAFHGAGSIRLRGRELIGADERVLRAVRGDRMAMIFQEPMTSLNPLLPIGRQVSEAFRHAYSRRQKSAKVIELLTLVGLGGASRRIEALPGELSGGQRQRVMIAMALANEPDVLICDEPTTALDVTIQMQILTLLSDLQRRFGMAILLITHDLGIVRRMATSVCVMRAGEIVETGSVAAVFSHPQHAYTRTLLAAQPVRRARPDLKNAPVLLTAENLTLDFSLGRSLFGRTSGRLRALDDVGLVIRQGETVGVVGESGSGKTTLGLALLRLIKAKGDIRFEDRLISKLSKARMRPLRQQMQMVFQDPYGALSPRRTIEQIVGEGLDIHALASTPAERKAMIDRALTDVGLDAALAARFPHALSGGQRQRVAIARAIVLRPKLIILDEATSALDVSVQAQIVEMLRDLQQRYGLAYLFISHDLRVVRALADTILVMKDGRIVEAGPCERLFSAPENDYTRALMSAAFAFAMTPAE